MPREKGVKTAPRIAVNQHKLWASSLREGKLRPQNKAGAAEALVVSLAPGAHLALWAQATPLSCPEQGPQPCP